MAEKERLDILVVQNNPELSRETAQALIMAGNVYVDGQKSDKCGTKIKIDAKIDVKNTTPKYVSRGGFKLEKAILDFHVDVFDKICFDIGASTGGFTDCMLQNGAKKVYAIDVGYGQFAWKLRNDPRVVCMEKTNVRYVTKENVSELGHFASIDVSFISLTKVLEPVCNLLSDDGQLVCLIKPQFEAGREKVGKKGVVKDPNVHFDVIKKIIDHVFNMNLFIINISYSPLRGPEGNIEYLIFIDKKNNGFDYDEVIKKASETVEAANRVL